MGINNPSIAGALGIPGTYNLRVGLYNWYNSWGLCTLNSAGTGYGGIDVVFACDSIGEGSISTNPAYDGWHHQVKLDLQAALNPVGVIGGYGFMSSVAGYLGTPATYNTIFGTTSNTQVYQSIKNLGLTNNNANGSNGSYFTLDGTLPARFRGAISSIQYIGSAEAGIATASRVDCGSNTPGASMIGAGNVFSGTHNQAAAGSTGYYGGARFGTATAPSNSNFVSGFSPSAKNYVQWASMAAGGLNSEYDGIIAYNGDEQCGVRCHDMSHYGAFILGGAVNAGAYLSDYGAGNSAIGLPGSGQQGPSNIGTVWGDSTIASPVLGSKSAKLYVLDFITNECGEGASPTITKAAFTLNVNALAAYILALPSKPSILWLIPSMSNAAALVARAPGTGTFSEFAGVIYAAALSLGFAVLDMNVNQEVAATPYDGSPLWLARGYTTNSGGNQGIHPVDTGHQQIRRVMTQVLLGGI